LPRQNSLLNNIPSSTGYQTPGYDVNIRLLDTQNLIAPPTSQVSKIVGEPYIQNIGDAANGFVMMEPFNVAENRIPSTAEVRETTGRESRFIYPPMINFRIGDLYVDQPAILSSVSMTIPEDANWESFRGESYKYLYGINKNINIPDTKVRQLPTQVDITVSVKVLEKKQSITNGGHYGLTNYNNDGTIAERWVLDTL
jgi:hypothetical protein